MTNNIIWTIGHSTRSLQDFLALLHSFKIEVLVDIRNYPGSRRYPHFNKEALETSLPANGIQYIHLKELGGRRKPVGNSTNTAWRNEAFRGYADYMQTAEFKKAIEKLESIAQKQFTAYMCSEAVWWSCHRALVSDELKSKGWTILHIMDVGKATEHPYTKPARVIDGVLRYDEPDLFT
ncbi:MAG TPA: DUF488 domain-containing protein [Flavisolibacter sp.]|nr:DUF488 domain-containing protein [Flavisolibacter sp.]